MNEWNLKGSPVLGRWGLGTSRPVKQLNLTVTTDADLWPVAIACLDWLTKRQGDKNTIVPADASALCHYL